MNVWGCGQEVAGDLLKGGGGGGWEMVGMPGRNNELTRRRMDGEMKRRIGKKEG